MILSKDWTLEWNASSLVALYSVANATTSGTSRMVAVLCGPIGGAPACGSGAAGSDLVNGTLSATSIINGSPVGMRALSKL